MNNRKFESLLCSSNFIVLTLREISRGHEAHPSPSRENCHSGMPNRTDTHLSFLLLLFFPFSLLLFSIIWFWRYRDSPPPPLLSLSPWETHLFLTSPGKVVSLATQSNPVKSSYNEKISWPVFVGEAPGNSCGDLDHCAGTPGKLGFSPTFAHLVIPEAFEEIRSVRKWVLR